MSEKLNFRICRTDYPRSIWNGKEWEEFGFSMYPSTTASVIVVGINERGEEVSLEEFIEKPLGTWVIPTREGLVYCRSIGAAIAVIEEEFDAVEDDKELTAFRLDEKEVGWEQAFWVRRYTITRYRGSFSVDAERLKV